jgi:SAM-dependent methyltransferase
MTARAEERYWETVLDGWRLGAGDRLWRRHSDGINGALCRRWLAGDAVERLLKTDTFDEAVAGGLMPLLSTRARVVVGVDLAEATVRAASGRHPLACMSVADVRRLPFAAGAFDAVVSLSTLDHFRSSSEVAVALGELARVLRPGGRLVLTMDNLANPVVALRNVLPFELLHRLNVVPYYVGRSFRPARLCRLLGDSGFDVLETTAVLHCPRVLCIVAARLLTRFAATRTHEGFLAALEAFEALAAWPTRYVTGYFIAALARRRR